MWKVMWVHRQTHKINRPFSQGKTTPPLLCSIICSKAKLEVWFLQFCFDMQPIMNLSTNLALCNLPDCKSPGVCPWEGVEFTCQTWFKCCSVFGWRQPEGQAMDDTVTPLFSAFLSPLSASSKDFRVKECLFFLLSKAGWCLWGDCTANVEHEQGGMTVLPHPNIVFCF